MKKRGLSAVELAECQSLKELWQAKKSSLGLTQEKVAARLGGGVTQGAVSHYLNGKNPLNLQAAVVFSQALDIPIEAFSPRLAREQARIAGAQSVGYPTCGVAEPAATFGAIAPVAEGLSPSIIRGWIPLISWVQAGAWSEAVDLYEPGYAEKVVPTSVRHSEFAFALRVEGDSMTLPEGVHGRSFLHGMVIYVDPRKCANPGDYVVARSLATGRVTFKKLHLDEGRPILVPLNPDRAEYPIIRDEFEIIGRVIDAGWGGL